MRSTYFSYGGDFHEQREGAVMGSPVSAAVANLDVEYFEDLALSQAWLTVCPAYGRGTSMTVYVRVYV